MYQHKLHKE